MNYEWHLHVVTIVWLRSLQTCERFRFSGDMYLHRVRVTMNTPPPRHLIAILITPRSRSVQVYNDYGSAVGRCAHNVPERFKCYIVFWFRDAKGTSPHSRVLLRFNGSRGRPKSIYVLCVHTHSGKWDVVMIIINMRIPT